MPKKVNYFVMKGGYSPFENWLNKLDHPVQAIILRTIQRVATGGAKKSIKSLKENLFEIKISHGPGYRVYFAEEGNRIIILLIGGNKRTQNRDIKKAREYWSSYKQ